LNISRIEGFKHTLLDAKMRAKKHSRESCKKGISITDVRNISPVGFFDLPQGEKNRLL
jgi:hypothetical protein